MWKKLLSILVMAIFVLGISNLSLAVMCGHGGHQQTTQEEHKGHTDIHTGGALKTTPEEPVIVGNKICPVSSEKIDEKTKVTYKYKGKIYNFCCAMCIDEFKKDLQKYIKKVEEELQTEPKEEAKEEQDEQMDSSMH